MHVCTVGVEFSRAIPHVSPLRARKAPRNQTKQRKATRNKQEGEEERETLTTGLSLSTCDGRRERAGQTKRSVEFSVSLPSCFHDGAPLDGQNRNFPLVWLHQELGKRVEVWHSPHLRRQVRHAIRAKGEAGVSRARGRSPTQVQKEETDICTLCEDTWRTAGRGVYLRRDTLGAVVLVGKHHSFAKATKDTVNRPSYLTPTPSIKTRCP